MSEAQHSKLEDCKQTLILASPLIAAQLAQMGMEFVDTVMIGRLGLQELASAALSGVTYISVLVFFIGLLNAVGVAIARSYGERNATGITHNLWQGIVMAGLASIPAMLIVWFIPSYFLLTGQDPMTVELSRQYLHVVVFGIPGFLLFITLREFSSALHHPTMVMWISIAAIPLNAALNYIFIYGKFGFPEMGIAGAAMGTVLVDCFLPLSLIGFIYLHHDLKRYFRALRQTKVCWKSQKELFRVGWPIGTMFCFEVGLFSVTALMMGHFGTSALAAHQVAIQTSSVAFMFFLGLSHAVGIRISHAIGAQEAHRANMIGMNGTWLGFIVATVTAFSFYFFPELIASFFLDIENPENATVLKYAGIFLQVAALFQFFDALQVIMSGALQGFKDTFVPMLLGLLSYWIIGIAAGYWLGFKLEYGSVGLWWGLTIGLAVSGLLLFARFKHQISRFR